MERRKVQLDNQPIDFTSFAGRSGKPSGLRARSKGYVCDSEANAAVAAQSHYRRNASAPDFYGI